MKPTSCRNIACRACASARTPRAVLGASTIEERKPITFPAASTSPAIDEATEIPSIVEVSAVFVSERVIVESKDTIMGAVDGSAG